MELVLVKAFYHKHDAEMAKGLLEDKDIMCLLKGDDVGGYRPHVTLSMGNYQILVREEDLETAKEILGCLDAG